MSIRQILFGLAVLFAAAACTAPVEREPTDTAPIPSAGPPTSSRSQSLADAKRDGVAPVVAALSLEERVRVAHANVTPFRQASVGTKEGVWIASHPDRPRREGEECVYETPEGVQYICAPEYGEILLMDHENTRILRAFPLPAIPPQYIQVFDDAVYCGRQGDGALGHSMLCRIDRETFELTVRIFQPPIDQGWNEDVYRPKTWAVDKGQLELYDFYVDDQGIWVKDFKDRWTQLGLRRLEPIARSTEGPAPPLA
jgi:hypothetical protein